MEKNIEEKKQKKEIQESESQIRTLSEDVLREHIMSKLPIKPLMRFKCVSKTWLSSISSPQFTPKSRLKSFASSSYSPPQFLLLSGNRRARDQRLFTWVLIDKHGRLEEFASLVFTYKVGVPIHVVGSYNGLVCFVHQPSKFTICNPVTYQFNEIPDITIPNSFFRAATGFYYLGSIDDYKIVCLMTSPVLDEQNCMVVYVFSLRTGQWETLANVHGFPIAQTAAPALVNDTIYWVAKRGSVVGLNLVNGGLHTLRTPYTANTDLFILPQLSGKVKVFGINGRLSMYFKGKVWVLDQDGSSWTKLHDLKSMRLLCVCQTSGSWLVLNNGRLALLNPSKSLTVQYQGGIRFVGRIYNAWNCQMSLISPVLE